MLAQQYGFWIQNNSGATLTDVVFSVNPWKFDANGALEYGAEQTLNQPSIGDATGANTTPIDNRSDKYLGAHIHIAFTGGGSGDVQVSLWPIADGVAKAPTQMTDVLVSVTAPDGKSFVVEI